MNLQAKIKQYQSNRKITSYLQEYKDDPLRQIMSENFDHVLDNLVALGKELNFTKPSEYLLLTSILIGLGTFNNGHFHYDEIETDILTSNNNQELAFTIFNGYGICRHVTMFLHHLLDKLNITNSIILAKSYSDGENVDENLEKIWSSLNRNFHILPPVNHVVNYINDNGSEYIFDFGLLYYVDNQLAYPFSHGKEINSYTLFLYNHINKSRYRLDAKEDCENIQPLPIKKQLEITKELIDAQITINKNQDALDRFQQQNQHYCQNIQQAYQQVLEKESSLWYNLFLSSALVKKKTI